MTSCPLSPLLSCKAGEGAPPKIEIIVTNSDEVKELREKLDALGKDYLQLQQEYKRTEWKYACECNLRMQITDWCREQGISIPKRFFDSL